MPGFTRNHRFARRAGMALGLVFSLAFLLFPPKVHADEKAAQPVDFIRDIQPIFAAHCQECHGAKRQEGGLRLTSRESAFAGGDSGQKAVVPSDPKASRLIAAISGADEELKMPPEGEGEPLSPEQVAMVTRWVNEGANWPREAEAASEHTNHWAWQKPKQAPLPAVKQSDWPQRPLDYFVLEQIERAGLRPAEQANSHALVRRVYLDLVGLPPSIEQVEAFVTDTQPDAYERMVDRALADPGYGERWARVWLDLARYADSKGYGSDPLRTIWRYRDWVIEALNRNLPFDRFTIEQLAGDLLPQATPEQVLATAFHRNTMANDEGGTDDEEFRVAAVKDRIETTMQVWMGLTMGCAKCHSHKFDPITQREYYQAYAFFNQTEDADRGDETPKVQTPTTEQLRQMAERRSALARLEQQLFSPPQGIDPQVAAWEAAIAAAEGQWQILKPTAASGSDEVKLATLDDGSIRVEGQGPERSTYHVSLPTDLVGITGFRLEVLPDASLPRSGPGLSDGNFVLNELRVTARRTAPSSTPARFVRLEIAGDKKILALAEVQVFHGEQNLALQGKATQSSNFGEAVATRAIDNQTDGDYDNKSVTHTGEETNPWWELDLTQTVPVDRVVVWNRTDHELHSRLNGLRVLVLDEQRRPLWQQTLAKAPEISQAFDLASPGEVELVEASADFSQDDWPVPKAIDGDLTASSGWAIAPSYGKSHHAVFRTKNPVGVQVPISLEFTLTQSYGGTHLLGRFRIAATIAAVPGPALPENVLALLATPRESRSAEQQAELARYYWSHSPATQDIRAQMARIDDELKAIDERTPVTPIMRELPPDKQRVTHTMIKGNYLVPGDAVQPALPAAFHPLPAGAPTNRMGLAMWLINRDNPLTSRVLVNRLWAQIFGTGLVATEEDFGTQGLPPTHPELLDWLAVSFQDGGWDIKQLLREIVTSATYRQSSVVGDDVVQKDPNNHLLARGPRLRLEAEMVRDQALAIAGLLSRKQGGPSVYPPQPDGLWRAAFNGERTWATSPGGDRYRRGLYTYWRRSVPYPSMAVFDAPSREICTLRRIPTNTPLQAFVMLNDPVYVEAAQALARRIVSEGGASPQERSAFVLRLALSRPPKPEQVEQLVALHQSELIHYKQNAEAAAQMAAEPLGPVPAGMEAAELAAWTVVSNVVLNLDGVLTKR